MGAWIGNMNHSILQIIIRVILVAAAVLLFIDNALLFASGASRNLGSLTAIILSLLVITYGIFMPRIHHRIAELWKKGGGGRNVLAVIGVLTIVVLLTVAVETIFMCAYSNREAPASEREPVVIVLGCQVRNGAPSLLLQARIDAAYEYLTAHPGAYCIASGGKGADEAFAEAKCIRDELVKRGIEESRIFVEDRSTSTRENMLFSKEIMEREDLGDTAVIVTNAWHELRAQMIASDLGLLCGGYGASTAWWLLPSYYLRELFGIIYQIVM